MPTIGVFVSVNTYYHGTLGPQALNGVDQTTITSVNLQAGQDVFKASQNSFLRAEDWFNLRFGMRVEFESHQHNGASWARLARIVEPGFGPIPKHTHTNVDSHSDSGSDSEMKEEELPEPVIHTGKVISLVRNGYIVQLPGMDSVLIRHEQLAKASVNDFIDFTATDKQGNVITDGRFNRDEYIITSASRSQKGPTDTEAIILVLWHDFQGENHGSKFSGAVKETFKQRNRKVKCVQAVTTYQDSLEALARARAGRAVSKLVIATHGCAGQLWLGGCGPSVNDRQLIENAMGREQNRGFLAPEKVGADIQELLGPASIIIAACGQNDPEVLTTFAQAANAPVWAAEGTIYLNVDNTPNKNHTIKSEEGAAYLYRPDGSRTKLKNRFSLRD
ncbi:MULTISPECIES: hypothetical protein [unclassified Corallococcus]|uniref:hypothetical protein n=1 Tax=unclassified Corallococcus TaxID=2685029 RepID=UPI001A8C5A8F|nr:MULTISPECIES: hypothetical protein [unclassified Corallococcus]MBN9687504.1 hypothetical protein [Corallococcus sp. NCSPR001]WAS88673.1 hypothetical protein O0N60_17195 [Corallococcus sp. NCRR]